MNQTRINHLAMLIANFDFSDKRAAYSRIQIFIREIFPDATGEEIDAAIELSFKWQAGRAA